MRSKRPVARRDAGWMRCNPRRTPRRYGLPGASSSGFGPGSGQRSAHGSGDGVSERDPLQLHVASPPSGPRAHQARTATTLTSSTTSRLEVLEFLPAFARDLLGGDEGNCDEPAARSSTPSRKAPCIAELRARRAPVSASDRPPARAKNAADGVPLDNSAFAPRAGRISRNARTRGWL